MIRKLQLFIFTLFFSATFIPDSHALTDKLYEYPTEMLFQSAYRFLVLDKGFEINQENPEIGLIKFTYVGGGITDKAASLEIVANAAGPGTNRVRVQVPSVSSGTMSVLLDELNKKIKRDYSSASQGEQIYNYSYDKLYSSIYRYLTVDKEFDIVDAQKEKGIIAFKAKTGDLALKKSFCEIFKLPNGSHKVRLNIPNLSSASLRVYLLGITEKLKKDYERPY